MCFVDLGRFDGQRVSQFVDAPDVGAFACLGQREKRAIDTVAAEQRIGDIFRQGEFFQYLIHGRFQHSVEQRKNTDDEQVVALAPVHQVLAQQFREAATGDGGFHQRRWRGIFIGSDNEQGQPTIKLLIAENGQGVADRLNFTGQSETDRIDVAEQLE